LYIVLEDHKNESLSRLYALSQSKCIREATEKEPIALNAVVLKESRNYSSEFISTMWLTVRIDSKVAAELRQAIPAIKMHIYMKLVDQHDPKCFFVIIQLFFWYTKPIIWIFKF